MKKLWRCNGRENGSQVWMLFPPFTETHRRRGEEQRNIRHGILAGHFHGAVYSGWKYSSHRFPLLNFKLF
jgi:hypothetical protein